MQAADTRPKSTHNETGLFIPLLGFLDRNLSRFSPPVRDSIGVGVLLILVIYVLNGLVGSTYIRGQLFVDEGGIRTHAAGWRVLLGDSEAVTNDSGWWTLPLRGNGIPGWIRLEIEDAGGIAPDGSARKSLPVGEVHVFGPWPVLNTVKPMDSVLVDVYPGKPPEQRVQIASSGIFDVLALRSVYAQSTEASKEIQPVIIREPPCALSLNEVSVSQFPGFLRSSGRAYFQMYLDNKLVDGNALIYGPGIGAKVGQFPIQSNKELWLPVGTGSSNRYNLLADLTDVATCSHNPDGKVEIRPKGSITLKMFADQGDLLNSFDLGGPLASPNVEVALPGQPNGRASVKVEALAGGILLKVHFTYNTRDDLRMVALDLQKDIPDTWILRFTLYERSERVKPFGSPAVSVVAYVPPTLYPNAEVAARSGLTSAQQTYAFGSAADAAMAMLKGIMPSSTGQPLIQNLLK